MKTAPVVSCVVTAISSSILIELLSRARPELVIRITIEELTAPTLDEEIETLPLSPSPPPSPSPSQPQSSLLVGMMGPPSGAYDEDTEQLSF